MYEKLRVKVARDPSLHERATFHTCLFKKRNVESFCKNVSYNVVILPNRMQI